MAVCTNTDGYKGGEEKTLRGDYLAEKAVILITIGLYPGGELPPFRQPGPGEVSA